MTSKCACCAKRYKGENKLFCPDCLRKYEGNPPIVAEIKYCDICGDPFCPTQPKKMYCSDECSEKGTLNTKWWRDYKKADDLAKTCMLARRNGLTYGEFQVAIAEGKLTKKGCEDRARQQELRIQEGKA